ncbi:cell wall metabolism sensor histidine kinase WalK [Ruminococcus sp.]|uniref:sensor histidine kinase n=1 Tax=Ruminococcus sp. TaxID=41978 RepID=UPI0026102C29|nr:HAMP domain-containing sensor histidine kinase [Ruminococcus sp.]MDD6989796.1 HAMP domain-containing sensor histidine kinase [Ruminococcus sp.]MDY6202798.1 HAMP domain-containing sensor histidine kinase [Ruminococcus sp.]
MIKRLRKNIILVNILLVGTVILLIFAAVCINSYSSAKTELERSMNMIAERSLDDYKRPPEKFGEKKHDNQPSQLNSYITVAVDYEGNILSRQESNATIDEDILSNSVSEAISSDKQVGEIGEYNLTYVKNEQIDRIIIVFADNSSVYSTLRNTILVCLGLFLASMAVIFLISLALSGIAVNPVKDAWNKQKQFVADASHELKTPLTVILANNNIMMSHKDSKVEDEIKWLQSTEDEAQHMKKLIDQMLFLAKSDAENSKTELTKVNVSEIIEASSLNFEPIAFEKGILLDCEIEPDIIADSNATMLNQLSHILIDNAVKYSASSGIVKIKLLSRNDKLIFSVNNYGNVISKEELAHIFDRFYRAEKSRTTKGYGLGLSIAQNITNCIGGKISVESSEDKGTTFSVEWNI